MFPEGCTPLLLLLGVFTLVFGADPPNCEFPNNTKTSNDYGISISPETLYNDTEYTVLVTSKINGSVQVLLQALTNNTPTGKWSAPGNVDCPVGPLLNFTFDVNKSLSANWTSPSSPIPDSVLFWVLIKNGNITYKLSNKLSAGSANAASSVQPLSMIIAIMETLGLLVITSKLL